MRVVELGNGGGMISLEGYLEGQVQPGSQAVCQTTNNQPNKKLPKYRAYLDFFNLLLD